MVVDAGDGVLSSLRRTNHTATAIAARSRTKPTTNRPTGVRLRPAWYWSVSGSKCICGRGAPIASVLAAPA